MEQSFEDKNISFSIKSILGDDIFSQDDKRRKANGLISTHQAPLSYPYSTLYPIGYQNHFWIHYFNSAAFMTGYRPALFPNNAKSVKTPSQRSSKITSNSLAFSNVANTTQAIEKLEPVTSRRHDQGKNNAQH